nr:LOW QUALITY PROTEIN: kinetochore protein Nuf2-like [Rhipicephalus microplus]
MMALKALLEQCFSVRVTRQELEAPTTAVVIRVLHGAFSIFGLNEVALEVPRSLLPSEAMHIEGSIPIGHYLKLMQVVLGIVGVNDVGLQDLTNPKPRRTRRLLKILVNKLLQATAVFSKYTRPTGWQLSFTDVGEQDEAVASELSACKKTLAAYAEEKAVIVSDYQQLKTTLCDSAEAVEKAKLQIMELKEALEEKRAAVCRDPASWKENISADVETLATLESEIEKLRSIVSTVNEKVSLSPRISEEYSKSLESLAGMEEHAAEVEMLQQTKTAQEKKRIELEQAYYALQKKVELASEELKRLEEKQPLDAGLQSREERNNNARQTLQQLQTTMKQTKTSAIAKLSEMNTKIPSTQDEIDMHERAMEQHVARNQQVLDAILHIMEAVAESFGRICSEDSLAQPCSVDEASQSSSEDRRPSDE